MSSTLSPAYAKLLKELEKHERMLAKYRKVFEADGKITGAEQQKLDKIQAAIDGIIKALTADSEIVVVTDPPPSVPNDVDGPIQYEGIPLDKLTNAHDKNLARRKRTASPPRHQVPRRMDSEARRRFP